MTDPETQSKSKKCRALWAMLSECLNMNAGGREGTYPSKAKKNSACWRTGDRDNPEKCKSEELRDIIKVTG